MFKLIFKFSVFAVLICFCYGKLDESIIRKVAKEYLSDDQIVRQYSDGKDVVTVFFTLKNDIVECQVEKNDANITQSLFKQAIQNPLKEEQYLFQEDVAKIGRRCRKMIRDIKRSPIEELNVVQKRFKQRLELDALLPKTKYCARQFVPVPEEVVKDINVQNISEEIQTENKNNTAINSETDSLVPESEEKPEEAVLNVDKCCKIWQQCPQLIHALSWNNGLFNPYPWPMRSCDCQQAFKECIEDDLQNGTGNEEDKKEIKNFYNTYFNDIKTECFLTQASQKQCSEYDFWHTECLTKQTVEQFVLRKSIR